MSTTSLTIRNLPSAYIGLLGKVLAYAGDNAAGGSLARYADGVVFHGIAGFRAARMYAGGSLCVIDPAVYMKDRGQGTGARLFSETSTEAVQAQVHAGADCLLAPSRFPIERDAQAINALLNEGESFIDAARIEAPSAPAFVPLVIRFDELVDGRWVEPIRSSGLPIATVFAGYGDPLATVSQLEGAIRIVEAAEVSFVLRCDVSAVGPDGAGGDRWVDRRQFICAPPVVAHASPARQSAVSKPICAPICQLDEGGIHHAVRRRSGSRGPVPL